MYIEQFNEVEFVVFKSGQGISKALVRARKEGI